MRFDFVGVERLSYVLERKQECFRIFPFCGNFLHRPFSRSESNPTNPRNKDLSVYSDRDFAYRL